MRPERPGAEWRHGRWTVLLVTVGVVAMWTLITALGVLVWLLVLWLT